MTGPNRARLIRAISDRDTPTLADRQQAARDHAARRQAVPILIDPEPIPASVHRVPTVTRQALARDEHLAAARRHLIAAGAGSAWVEDVIVEAARRGGVK